MLQIVHTVLRTYGSSSPSAFFNGGARYSTIFSTLMHPIVRMASARMRGDECSLSLTNELTACKAKTCARVCLGSNVEASAYHDGQVRIALGIVDQVEVHQLLDLNVICRCTETSDRVHMLHKWMPPLYTPVRMQFTTSGKSAFMSFPTVIAAITFLTASFIVSRSEAPSSVLNSDTSPAIRQMLIMQRARHAHKN
jgi:hypothetical protein